MKLKIRKTTYITALLLLLVLTFNAVGCNFAAGSNVSGSESSSEDSTEDAKPVEDPSESESSSEDSTEDAKPVEDPSESEEASETEDADIELPWDDKEPLELSAVDLMASISANKVSVEDDLSAGNAKAVDFAIRLFKAANESDKNTLISPTSVMYALAMAANGANGETREEIEATLGMSVEELNSYLYSYSASLKNGEKFKLNVANSIWFTDDDRFTVNGGFLQKNADYYGADIYKAPFDESTLDDINLWVEKNTDGLIRKALDEIPPEAVMYIVNALLFDAEWGSMYSEYSVAERDFTQESGDVKKVELMFSEEPRYLEGENATGFIKAYAGGKYGFAALLPDEGMTVSEFIDSLDGESLSAILNGVSYTAVNAAIPKFESAYDTEMSRVLQNMGIVNAFDHGTADFSGLGRSVGGNIAINRVIHKTFIEVGEQGTRAGAVTVIEMTEESEPMEPPKSVILDRPFVYMILDLENNVPIFIGAMMGY